MINRGIATFGLDTGKCPKWLFTRMVKLGNTIIEVIANEYSPSEFVQRLGDPVWFQSLGTVLAFDWNASGLTTILTAAIKEALRGQERRLGIFACGGKGKTSLKTPDELLNWGNVLSLPECSKMAYNSKMAAKVDSSLVQDGYQLYHHAFFFAVEKNKISSWTVVQQGMNQKNATARRYHWNSRNVTDLVCEPHSGIASQKKSSTLDLSAKKSEENRGISTNLVQQNYNALMNDIKILRKHSSSLSQMVSMQNGNQQLTLLNLETKEFDWHPVVTEDFNKSKYLDKILWKVTEQKPRDYEKLLSLEGVGPKTIRALSLVAEVIYGAKPSYEDPARYSFAHGGKDGTPYPVDRNTYDKSIEFFRGIIPKIKAPFSEKEKLMSKLNKNNY